MYTFMSTDIKKISKYVIMIQNRIACFYVQKQLLSYLMFMRDKLNNTIFVHLFVNI